MTEPTQICRGFTDEQWRELRERLIRDGKIQDDEAAWSCAVDVFERRIRERFLSCVEALEKADSGPESDIDTDDLRAAPPDCSTLPNDHGRKIVVPGFAIMALCCLLIETLQSFRETRSGQSSTDVFEKFLRLPAFRAEFNNNSIASRFVRGIRDGILHEAETRRWVIWRNEPKDRIVEPRGDGYALNRTEFYKALKTEFEDYLKELREQRNEDRRKRFVEKMDDIVKEV